IAAVARRWRPGSAALWPVAALLVQVMLASLVLFLVAHALLFHLYLPARFVAWTVPLVLAIAAAVGIAALLDMLLGRFAHRGRATAPSLAVGVAAALLAGGLALYPAHFDGNFVRDRTPAITAYLRT